MAIYRMPMGAATSFYPARHTALMQPNRQKFHTILLSVRVILKNCEYSETLNFFCEFVPFGPIKSSLAVLLPI